MEKKELKKYLIIAVIVVGICLVVKNLSVIASFIRIIFSAVTPLIIGAAIAYVFNILMSFCERHYFPKKKTGFAAYTRRPVCMVLSFAIAVAIISLIMKLVIPELVTAIKLLSAEIPGFLINVKDWSIELLKDYPEVQEKLSQIEIQEQLSDMDWKSITENAIGFISDGAAGLFSSIAGFIGAFASSVVNIVIAIIFAMYLLVRKDRIREDIRRAKNAYLSEKINLRITKIYHTTNTTFKSFFVGQFAEAIILGLLCTIGMSIFRFPYAGMTGAVIGVTALIPIVGAYVGAGVGAFMICTVDPMKALWFIVFIVILQQLEGNIIYPKVVGSSVGLPGIWVLAAVTVGGGLGGIIGMLFGVPIFATVYKLCHTELSEREVKLGIAVPAAAEPSKPQKPQKPENKSNTANKGTDKQNKK